MINPIGIMQGRLSPPVGGRIQSFPVKTWRQEFALAREAGLACIEWIYETGTAKDNPMSIDEGITEIQSLAEKSGVSVPSLCADYYMDEHLVTYEGKPHDSNVLHLKWLLSQVERLGLRYLVLPFVDISSLKSSAALQGLLSVLRLALPTAERSHVEIHLETDLASETLAGLMDQVSHPLVRINYDIGNSASLGHNPAEELTILAKWLGSVHVKDRVLRGGTVPLGTGAADFPTCFRFIRSADFKGPLILQAARVNGISEVELAVRNRKFIEEHFPGS